MKKKLLTALLTITCMLCLAFGLSACDMFGGKDNGGDGGDTHTHNLIYMPPHSADCYEEGNTAYYVCSVCDKYFADEDGATEITDKNSVVIAPTHALKKVDEKPSSCTEEGNREYYVCGICNKYFADENGATEITVKSSVVTAISHSLTIVEANDSSCSAKGNTEYFVCEDCDKYFADENGTDEITDKTSVIIQRLPHDFVNGICTVCETKQPTEGLQFYDYRDYYAVLGMGTATDTEIVIPDEYEGKPVKEISRNAFKNHTNITSITIPDSVTEIEATSFEGCSGLKTINIPDGVTIIDYYTFSGCSSLTEITFSDSITFIGHNAFYGCSSLTSITLGNSIPSIRDYTFYGCSSLTSITIGNGITNIGDMAFSSCPSLTDINYTGDLESWVKISNLNNLMRCNTNDKHLFIEGEEITGELVIPDGIYVISNSPFAYCSGLTSIILPDSLVNIYDSAFYGCTELKNISIPSSVKTIGEKAFYNCSSLTSISIPASVTDIGKSAFYNCSSLTSVAIPAGIAVIHSDAFSGCSSLTDISIPDSVVSIESSAFNGCGSLADITIPDSVSSIGSGAFADTAYYNKTSNWSNGVLYIGKHLIDAKTTISGSYEIKQGTLTIAYSAFYGCRNLTDITIPDTVKYIGISAFKSTGYYNNESNWEDGVLYIGKHLIEAKTTVSGSYEIKQGTLTIAGSAFYKCASLTGIIIPDGAKGIGSYAFYGCSSLADVSVPDSITYIGEYAFCDCASITSINIPDSVTYIGNYTFYYCIALTDVTLSDSVTYIGDYAFGASTGLKNMTLPSSLTFIGKLAFTYCRLADITLPDSVQYISVSAFVYGYSVSAVIPDSVTRIEASTFYDSRKLTEITIGSGVKSIGDNAFAYCYALTSITYNGTMEQWEAIKKGTAWDNSTGKYTIHCTDGDIAKS